MNKQFTSGIKDSIPICLGVIPVGISFGLLALQAGFSSLEAISMSIIVMAGSSQLMAIGMISQGATLGAIILATFFINLRFIIMSSAIMSYLKETPLLKKLVGAFAIGDEAFAIFLLSDKKDISYLLGINTAIYIAWVVSSGIGCVINQFLPEIIINSFGIAFYAAFIAMLIPSVKGNYRLIILVCITAVINTLLQLVLPSSWAVIISMILGVVIGMKFIEDKDLMLEEEVQNE